MPAEPPAQGHTACICQRSMFKSPIPLHPFNIFFSLKCIFIQIILQMVLEFHIMQVLCFLLWLSLRPSFKGRLKENVLEGKKTKKTQNPGTDIVSQYYLDKIQSSIIHKVITVIPKTQKHMSLSDLCFFSLQHRGFDQNFDFKVTEMQTYEKNYCISYVLKQALLHEQRGEEHSCGQVTPALLLPPPDGVRQRGFSLTLTGVFPHLSQLCRSCASSSTLSAGCLCLAISNSFHHLQSS